MTMIPQKELRNNIGEVLRRAEAGEELTITVSGRPVAVLGPIRNRAWIPAGELDLTSHLPPDPTFMRDIEEGFGGAGLRNPWEDTPS